MYAMNRLSAMMRPGLQMKRLCRAIVLNQQSYEPFNPHHARRPGLALFIHLVKLALEQLEKVFGARDACAALDKDCGSARG